MSNEIQFLLYNLPDKEGRVQVVIKDETIWCTQKAMAELFGIDKSGISRHIANIFKEEELQQDTTVAKIATVVNRGIRGEVEELVDFYNLDMIIAVGYRVSSPKATKFRQWATKILNEYIKKGFVLDDERLKQGTAVFGKDYFRELLERVRSIRASERRIWQQITDIYAECSIDYDKNSPTTHDFYAMIQNRFHYAITGQTAAEIIYTKADHTQEHMGLTTWKNAPDGRILKSDVSIAKNYLQEQELRSLERIVSAYLDLAEDRAERHIPMTMEDWSRRLDLFLMADDREILQDAGKITAEIAKAKAECEFEKYRVVQDRLFQSDYDRYLLELEAKAEGTQEANLIDKEKSEGE